MIGRADIEGSKSDVAMNAWPPQASYPCGNFSDTSCLKSLRPLVKGSIGHAFAVCNHTENLVQADICLFALREVSVPTESALGHLRYHFTDVPPQSNSQPDPVSRWVQSNYSDARHGAVLRFFALIRPFYSNVPLLFDWISKVTPKVVVFH